jgi:hypothetical protein
MEFKNKVLKLIAYYLQVNESKMKSAKNDTSAYYGAKVALLRDLYDDVKAIEMLECRLQNGRKRS